MRLPDAEDWRIAARLQAEAEAAGVGVAVLAAMIIRGLGCRMDGLRREDPRVTVLREERDPIGW